MKITANVIKFYTVATIKILSCTTQKTSLLLKSERHLFNAVNIRIECMKNSLFRQGSRGRITTLCLNRFIGFAPRLLGMLVELENSADHRIALKRIVTFYKEII